MAFLCHQLVGVQYPLFNIAIENCPFTVEFPMKIVISLSYSMFVYQRVSVVIGLLLLSGNQTQQLQIPIKQKGFISWELCLYTVGFVALLVSWRVCPSWGIIYFYTLLLDFSRPILARIDVEIFHWMSGDSSRFLII